MLNFLRVLDIQFLDEIWQVSGYIPYFLGIILQQLCENDVFIGSLLVMHTMYNTQLQPVNGKPFLLPYYIITYF